MPRRAPRPISTRRYRAPPCWLPSRPPATSRLSSRATTAVSSTSTCSALLAWRADNGSRCTATTGPPATARPSSIRHWRCCDRSGRSSLSTTCHGATSCHTCSNSTRSSNVMPTCPWLPRWRWSATATWPNIPMPPPSSRPPTSTRPLPVGLHGHASTNCAMPVPSSRPDSLMPHLNIKSTYRSASSKCGSPTCAPSTSLPCGCTV